MRNIIVKISNYKKTILELLFLPLMVYISTVLIQVLFNMGTYLGIFLRYIYYYVVC